MDLKNVMKFEGRLQRTEWWIASFLVAGAYLLAIGIAGVIATAFPELGFSVMIIAMFVQLYASVAVNKARANDAGWNGWVQIVPVLNIAVLVFFGTVKKAKKKKK